MFKLRSTRLLLTALLLTSCTPAAKSDSAEAARVRAKLDAIPMNEKVNLTNEEWKLILSPEQYHVLREAGTERPFANKYADNHEHGIYVCAACGNVLYRSETKFESGTGWPSFYKPIRKGAVNVSTDSSLGMTRDEITCTRCGSHLGHVFDDGPKPTGQRYCMNSAALRFEKK